MLLVSPPGSGKTHHVLAALESALAAGRPARLVVPTASMAEHLQHLLARRQEQWPGASGQWPVTGGQPRSIQPLAAFVEELTPDVRELPDATATLLVERALAAAGVREFEAVAAYAGFQAQLLETFQEFWSAGVDARELTALLGPATPFTRVMTAYEALLEKAGVVHRSRRLRLAAEALRRRPPGALFFDGFLNFTPVEIELLLAASPDLVTLPDAGAEDARRALLDHGFPETVLDRVRRPRPEPVVLEAPSPEREIEDIAGRLLADHARSGRPFREYGLILRHLDAYGPLVAVVFERFGIPFRLARAAPLAQHPAVRYLAGLLQATVDGFDALQTLDLLKLGGSGLACDPQLDRYDFRLRDKAPGAGVLFLLQLAEGFPRVKQFIARLEDLSRWAQDRLSPSAWAERCARLPDTWFALPEISDGGSHLAALECRELAHALKGWRDATDEAALLLEGEVDLTAYLRKLQAVLRLTPRSVPDRRRNVVQVLSVYEARQWELEVVFVCGLVEKQFPRYRQQNLFFPDGQRQRLALLGVRLRTTAEQDREERLLFNLARSRATDQLYLTHPAQDESGAQFLRSFFIPAEQASGASQPLQAAISPPSWRPSPGVLQHPDLLPPQSFSPSALERYIQCPFQFFAARTLRLDGPPPTPAERIDNLLKGAIIHRTIALWSCSPADPIGPVFERVFQEACADESIRLNFRAAALERELRADLERFARFERDRPKPPGFTPGAPESGIAYLLEDGLRITGRIDRHEVSAAGAVMVVDYKYSTPQRLKTICREQEQGLRVQAPLYLLGLEKERGLQPAGMLFYGLRDEPSRHGWLARGLAPDDPELEVLPPAEFRAMLDAAGARTVELVREIRSGHVEVKPRDLGFCRDYCEYREVCRISL